MYIESIITAYTARQIDLDSLANSANKKAIKSLDAVKAEILAVLFADLKERGYNQKEIEKKISSLYRSKLVEIIGEIKRFHSHLIADELEFSLGALNAVTAENVAIAATFVGDEIKDLAGAVLRVPFSVGAGVISDYESIFKSFEEDQARGIVSTVRSGMIYGKSNGEITADLMGAFDSTEVKIKRIVRTTTNHIANQTRIEGARQYDDILDGWISVAALDTRTSLICAALDGEIMKESDPRFAKFKPPRHPNCRTSLAPVVKSEYLVDGGAAGFGRQSNLNKRGLIDSKVTFFEELESSPPDKQDLILGPTLGEAYRRMADPKKFAQLITDRDTLRPITLKELKERNNDLTKLLKEIKKGG